MEKLEVIINGMMGDDGPVPTWEALARTVSKVTSVRIVRAIGPTTLMKMTKMQSKAHHGRMKLRGEKSEEHANLELLDGQRDMVLAQTKQESLVGRTR